jgi:hypothetical protein
MKFWIFFFNQHIYKKSHAQEVLKWLAVTIKKTPLDTDNSAAAKGDSRKRKSQHDRRKTKPVNRKNQLCTKPHNTGQQ